MKLIECKLGAAEPMIGSTPYKFERDRFGRFVVRVYNTDHAAILLSVEHYREVPEEPAPADEPKARGRKKTTAPADEPDVPPEFAAPGLDGGEAEPASE